MNCATPIDGITQGAPDSGRRLWLFRPPKFVSDENLALDEGLLVPAFGVTGDLSDHFEYEDVLTEVEQANPGEARLRQESWARQLHTLLHIIQAGDLIVVPLRRAGVFGVALARADSGLSGDGRPGRKIEWLTKSLDQSVIRADLLHSFEAKQSVCAITRNDALRRIQAMIRTGTDPGPEAAVHAQGDISGADIERMMRSRMLAKIGSSYAGHGLAELVGALLEVNGHRCRISPPGPDGGVDILAGRGIAGMSDPVVVQIKSGSIVSDGPTLQQLVGAMSTHGAAHGILVSWSGVTRTVKARISENWFRVRIWEAADVLDQVIEHYDALPLQIRDRLGFRKIMAV